MVSAAAGNGSADGVLATTMQGTTSAADVLAAFSKIIMASVVRAMACRLRLATAGDMSLLLRDLTACMTKQLREPAYAGHEQGPPPPSGHEQGVTFRSEWSRKAPSCSMAKAMQANASSAGQQHSSGRLPA